MAALTIGTGVCQDADTDNIEKKRGFNPGRFFGKWIPGGKSDDMPKEEASPFTNEPIPPPVIPQADEPAPLRAVPTLEKAPESNPARRVLSGVSGVVGKILPDGSRREQREDEPDQEKTGLIKLIRQQREPNEFPVPSPPIPAAPMATRQGIVSDSTLSDQPGPAPKKVLTIPVTPGKPAGPEVVQETPPPAGDGPVEKPAAGSDTKPETPPMAKPEPLAAAPAAGPMPASPPIVAATPPAPPESAPVEEIGGAHFVAIRDGVEAKAAAPDGTERILKPGTVLRFDSKTDTHVLARMGSGTPVEVELWQVRDATFEEAVKFIQSAD